MDNTSRTLDPEELLAQMSWVRRLARGLVADPAAAEDLAQETWLAATTSPAPEVNEGSGSLRAWLATVVRNLARQSGRARTRRTRRESKVARPETVRSTLDVVSRGALHEELSGAVMSLPEPYRSAILLRYLDGLSPNEVAERQECSPAAARQRLSRGLAKLREKLDDAHGGDREVWSMALLSLIDPKAGAVTATGPLAWVLPGGIAMNLKLVLAALAAVVLLVYALFELRPAEPSPETPEHLAMTDTTPEESEATGAEAATSTSRVAVTEEAAIPSWTVLDERGEPIVGLFALFLEADELIATGRSDQRGTIRSARESSPDEVLLGSASFAPRVRALEVGEPLVLPRGGRVAGEVSLGADSGPAPLRLASDRPTLDWPRLSPEVRAALAGEGVTAEGSILRLESGPFAFEGLGPGWSGALELRGEWRFTAARGGGDLEEGRALLLLDPVETLSLELSAPRSFTGRVLARGTREGVAKATVFCQPVPREALLPPAVTTSCDEAGRFSLAVATAPGGIERLRLEVSTPDGAAAATHDVALSTIEDGDLGELELDPEAADAPEDTRPGENSLLLRVVDPAGRAMPHLRLRVACDVLPFSAAGLDEKEWSRVASRRFRATFDLDPDAGLRLTDLRPGLLLDLTVVDGFGEKLTEVQVATPGSIQHEETEVVVTELPFTLRGHVRDSRGRDLPRVKIHAEVGSHVFSERTDADGGFTLGPFHSPVQGMYLEVKRPGFLLETRRDFEVTPDTPPLELTLEAGRSGVEVRLVDGAGTPLPGLDLWATFGERATRIAKEVGDGLYRFDLLPEAAGELVARAGGREFRHPIGADETHVDFELPPMGLLEVEVSALAEVKSGQRVCVVCTWLEDEEAWERVYFRNGAEDGFEPVTLTLPAGRYRVQLEARRLGRRASVEELGEPREVEVVSGKTLTLALP